MIPKDDPDRPAVANVGPYVLVPAWHGHGAFFRRYV